MTTSLHTPVLLLIFNRPGLTARVVEEIRAAKPGKLYVGADGPRSGVAGEKESCIAARQAVTGADWDCEVKTLFREQNLGCRNAINSALDWFFQNENEGIILEDDCLPSGSFFGFAQELLARYRDHSHVAMISGTNYLGDRLRIVSSYCFSRYFSIWGWASWRRVWQAHDKSMSEWESFRQKGLLRQYYRQAFMQRHVQKTYNLAWNGNVDTWDIQFSFSCLRSDALSVVPVVNLVSNIGGSGTHTSGDSRNINRPRFTLPETPLIHPSSVAPEPLYDEVFFQNEFGLHPLRWSPQRLRGLFNRIGRFTERGGGK